MICYYCRKNIADTEESIEGLHSRCFAAWFNIKPPKPFARLMARNEEIDSGKLKEITNSFFHGKFRKYSAHLENREYILKVQQDDVPELPATEYLCNQIAEHLGLNIPTYFLVRLQGDLDTFVAENFMPEYPAGNLIHIYRYISSAKDFTVEGLLGVIKKEIGSPKSIDDFAELCLFDSLIGNHDRHGRNIAIIEMNNKKALAPFYDNTSYIGIETPKLLGAYHEPRGAIRTKNSNDPTMKDYIFELKRLGFDKVIISFSKKINISKVEQIVKKSFISEGRKNALIKLIIRRYQEMLDAI